MGMKLGKKWNGGGYLLSIAMGVVFGLAALVGFLVPAVQAVSAGDELTVAPGYETLKTAMEKVNSGEVNTLKLQAGSYTGNAADGEVVISKPVTIEGVGGNFMTDGKQLTMIDVPLKIAVDDGSQVTLKKFMTSMQEVATGFDFITVDGNAHVTMEGVGSMGIDRGSEKTDETLVNITENADGAIIDVKDGNFQKPGFMYSFRNQASNTQLTFDNTEVHGRNVVVYDKAATGNKLTIQNNSNINGPSELYKDNEVFKIYEQDGMTIKVENSTITAVDPRPTGPVTVFALGDDDHKSKNVKIELVGSTIVDNDKMETSEDGAVVFGFAPGSTTADGYEIKGDKDTKFLRRYTDGDGGETELTTKRKYSELDGDNAVVGIYQQDGSFTAKIYAKGAALELNRSDVDEFKMRGWYKDKEYAEVFEDDNATGENMDLYPWYAKKITLRVGESEPFELVEGDKITGHTSEGAIKSAIAELKKKDGQDFRGFVVTSGDEVTTYTPEQEEDLYGKEWMADTKIEAIHKVVVTVNGVTFDLDAGDKLGKILEDEGQKQKFEEAKMQNAQNREFARFAKSGAETETFDLETPITESVTLVSKFYVRIAVKGTEYGSYESGLKIEEGQVLDTNEAVKTALEGIEKAPVENKQFGRFVKETDKSEVKRGEASFTEDTMLEIVYAVKVTIGDADEYTIDEGTNLASLEAKKTEIEGKLEDLVTAAGGQNFHGFVVSESGAEGPTLFEKTDATQTDKLIEQVMGKTLTTNTTIYAEYNVKVEIAQEDGSSAEFLIDTGKTLEDVAKLDQTKYDNAKLQGRTEEHFYRFVDETGAEFREDQEITKSVKLTPEYVVWITINGSKYRLKEGGKIDELIDEEGQEALTRLRTDKTADERELEFDHLEYKEVGSDTFAKLEDATHEFTKDAELRGVYHYTVEIETSYGQGGTQKFTVIEGKTFNDDDDVAKITAALEQLKTSAQTADGNQELYKFYERNAGKEYTQEELMTAPFNAHVYITAKLAYKVTAGEVSDFVPEGHKLGESSVIEGALAAMGTVPNKTLTGFIVNEVEVALGEINEQVISKATTVVPKYEVAITIGEGGNSYTIDENETLESSPRLTTEQKNQIKEELLALQTLDGMTFSEYSVGGTTPEEVMARSFTENTTVVAKHDITVTIDGTAYEHQNTGDTLNDIAGFKLDEYKAKGGDKTFSRFVDQDGETVDESYQFYRNTQLETKWAYKVTISGQTYLLEENVPLNGDAVILQVLKTLMEEPGKKFDHFEVEGTGKIELSDTVSQDTIIKPVYVITVMVGGQPFTVEEGKTLQDGYGVDGGTNLKAALDALENVDGKVFDKYIVNGAEMTRDQLLKHPFSENAEVTPRYNIVVTIKGGETMTVSEGTTFAGLPEEKLTPAKNNVPKGKSSFLHFALKDEYPSQAIPEDHVFNEATTIYPRYKIKLTIEGAGPVELEEGSPLSAVKEMPSWPQSTDKKDFAGKFKDKENGDDVSLETLLDKNTTLTPIYTIKVTIYERPPFDSGAPVYTLEEGQTLATILAEPSVVSRETRLVDAEKYAKPDGFVKFVDFDGGTEVAEGAELHEHTKVRAVYEVTVTTTPDGEYETESGKKLSEVGGLDLESLKADPEGKDRAFSRFVNEETGETINEEDQLWDNVTIVAKFKNKVEFYQADENGDQVSGGADEPLELGEGLSPAEETVVEEWIRQQLEAWARKNGHSPEDYEVTYVDEDGNEITDWEAVKGGKVGVVFTYKPQSQQPGSTPSTPGQSQPTEPGGEQNPSEPGQNGQPGSDNPQSGEESGSTPKAPNTGFSIENVSYGLATVSVAAVLVGIGVAAMRKFKLNK